LILRHFNHFSLSNLFHFFSVFIKSVASVFFLNNNNLFQIKKKFLQFSQAAIED